MISLSDALKVVLSSCQPSSPRSVPLAEALGLVLAAPIVASCDQPAFTNSAMDGFAVRAEDTEAAPVCLQLVGTIMAGHMPVIAIGRGQAVRIMTGALLPEGADGICILELSETQDDGSTVVIRQPVTRGARTSAARVKTSPQATMSSRIEPGLPRHTSASCRAWVSNRFSPIPGCGSASSRRGTS